jgi:hypothetical protein
MRAGEGGVVHARGGIERAAVAVPKQCQTLAETRAQRWSGTYHFYHKLQAIACTPL